MTFTAATLHLLKHGQCTLPNLLSGGYMGVQYVLRVPQFDIGEGRYMVVKGKVSMSSLMEMYLPDTTVACANTMKGYSMLMTCASQPQ